MTTFECPTCGRRVETLPGSSVVHICPVVKSGSDRYRQLKEIK